MGDASLSFAHVTLLALFPSRMSRQERFPSHSTLEHLLPAAQASCLPSHLPLSRKIAICGQLTANQFTLESRKVGLHYLRQWLRCTTKGQKFRSSRDPRGTSVGCGVHESLAADLGVPARNAPSEDLQAHSESDQSDEAPRAQSRRSLRRRVSALRLGASNADGWHCTVEYSKKVMVMAQA